MKRHISFFIILLSIVFLIGGCGNEETAEPASEPEEENTLEQLEGTWEGAIQVPSQPLPIIVSFQEDGGTISIPVQGLQDYPLASVELNDPELFFDMDIQNQRLTFKGELEENTISGTFTQQGQSVPFELTRGETEEETTAESDDGEAIQTEVKNGTMHALLEKPEGEGPFPVMVVIAGSGPTDKDGNSLALPGENNSLKMLAEALAKEGVATIRYDKRGVGENTTLAGSEKELRFGDYVQDAAAWVQYAKESELFSEVGIIGHSEGSLIGMAAANEVGVDSFVSLAGAGKPIDQVLFGQLEDQLPDSLMAEAKDILEKLKEGEQVETVSPELQSLFRPSVQPYMISWLQYNPREELAELDAPVLIVNGTRDLQVPVSNAEAMHEVKEEAELLILENMSHVLKEAPEDEDGNMATYSNPDLPLADGLVDGILDFLNEEFS